MTAPLPDRPPLSSASGTGWDRARVVVSGVAGLLGVVALLVAAAGWWSVRTLTDSSWVGPRVDTLLADPVVSDAIADRLVETVVETLDVRSAVVDLAPSQLEPLVDLLLSALRPRVEDAVASYVRRDEVRQTVAVAAERAYDVAIDLVEGRGAVDGVVVVDDEVRIVLLPLVGRALEALQSAGLFADVDVPDLARGGDPVAQRRALGEALGREIPDDFGEIVVYRSDAVEDASGTLKTVQEAFVLAGRAVWVAFAAGAAMVVLSVVLARRRVRAVGAVAIGLAVEVVVLQLVSARLVRSAVEVSTDPAGRVVIGDLVGAIQQRLVSTAVLVAVLAVVVLAIAMVIAVRSSDRVSGRGPSATDRPASVPDAPPAPGDPAP